MNFLAKSSLCVAAIAGACLLLTLTSLVGRDFVETVPSDVVELLASDRADELARGERLVAENGSHYITLLLERIRTGSPEVKGKAASELGIIISPWLRGKETGARFYSFTSFPAPRRPVGRVPQLAEAADIRQTLQTAISDLLKAAEVPSAQTHWLTESLRALCETLGEVANDETMDWAIDRLAQITSPGLAEPLLALGDSYLGLPPILRSGFLCGNSTRAEVEMFQRSEERALAEARRILSTQWTEVRSLKTRERIAFAIKSWREYFLPRQRSQSGHYRSRDGGWMFLDMEPLVRFGTPAVEPLRAQQTLETELEVKAIWEAVIATVTGRENAQLVRALFDGSDAHRELACEIVVSATSRDWLPQLEELQFRSGFQTGKASEAIAVCHRDAGIPALKRAFARNSHNFNAGYAVQELEMRAASGSPRGMRRYRFP